MKRFLDRLTTLITLSLFVGITLIFWWAFLWQNVFPLVITLTVEQFFFNFTAAVGSIAGAIVVLVVIGIGVKEFFFPLVVANSCDNTGDRFIFCCITVLVAIGFSVLLVASGVIFIVTLGVLFVRVVNKIHGYLVKYSVIPPPSE